MSVYRPTVRPRPARQSGFTIIEIMVAVAILAILVGVGAPSLRDFVIRSRISSQSSDLAVDLQLARSESARRGQRVMLCASNTTYDGCSGTATGWAAGWIVFADVDHGGSFNSGDEILRVHQALPTGVTLAVTPSVDKMIYRPTGLVDAARTFRVCQTGYQGRDIAISTTGRTSVSMASC